MKEASIDRLRILLQDKRQAIGIIAHTNPDGDAIGSSLGLFHWLNEQGFVNVKVIVPNQYPDFLHWMPGNQEVLVASDHPGLAAELIHHCSLIFCLDFNGFSRTAQLEPYLRDTPAIKVMIDHHPNPDEGFDLFFSDVHVSSTAELLYECLARIDQSHALSREVAVCLYAGIVTDTGSFSYGANAPRTYEIVARLVAAGVDAAQVHRSIYNHYSEDRMRLLGYCLSQKMKLIEGTAAAYISLSLADLARYNYREGDTEGIVNFALSIDQVALAALFIEQNDHVKVSFRSVGNLNVNSLARKHFHGGGHINAAGGKSFESLQDTLHRFERLIKKPDF